MDHQYPLDRARYDLLSPGSSSKLKAGEAIVISCIVSPDSLMTVEAVRGRTLPAILPSAEHSPTVPPTAIAMPKPEEDQALLESFVHSAAENSHISTPSCINAAGTVVDHISSATSSNGFDIVMGFLDKFVKIGDAITKVSGLSSLFLTFVHADLTHS